MVLTCSEKSLRLPDGSIAKRIKASSRLDDITDRVSLLSVLSLNHFPREPEKMLCKEIHVTEKDIKRYEESKAEEGELFG